MAVTKRMAVTMRMSTLMNASAKFRRCLADLPGWQLTPSDAAATYATDRSVDAATSTPAGTYAPVELLMLADLLGCQLTRSYGCSLRADRSVDPLLLLQQSYATKTTAVPYDHNQRNHLIDVLPLSPSHRFLTREVLRAALSG